MSSDDQILEEFTNKEYEFGWTVDLEADEAPKGLSEEIVRFISAKKGEPEWLLNWRLDAYRAWIKMDEPEWSNVNYPKIDYQDLIYYSAPKKGATPKSLDEIDPELLATFAKLGISLTEQKRLTGVAVDAVIDSVSVATTFKDTLGKLGIIFCSFSEAVKEHPELNTPELKSQIGDAAHLSLKLELDFIDKVYEMGDLKGCPKYDLVSFIKHRVNTKMSDLGYGPIVNGIDQDAVKRMKWFDSLSAGKQHTDFFANRVTNYSKGVQDWDANAIF